MAGNRETIEDKVAALGDLPREELGALWRKNFGCPPPKGVHRELLIRAAVFQLQQKHLGGLSGEAKRLLKAAMQDTGKTLKTRNATTGRSAVADPAEKARPAKTRKTIRAGARLMRDWNGKTHVVDVVESGFLYAGSRYKSLSKIARDITGTNWSGPRFFGL